MTEVFKIGDRVKTVVNVNEHKPGVIGTVMHVVDTYKKMAVLRVLTDCGHTFGLFDKHVIHHQEEQIMSIMVWSDRYPEYNKRMHMMTNACHVWMLIDIPFDLVK